LKKVLVINTNHYDYTGIVSFIRNYCYAVNDNNLIIEYAAFEIHDQFRNELDELKLTYYEIPGKKRSPYKYYLTLNKILKNNYDVVHVHGNSSLMAIELFLARLHGIKKRIAHCHNTTCEHMMLNRILRPLFIFSCTDRLACSIDSGKWMYGNNSFVVMTNAIDLGKFSFNENKRYNIRKELNILENEIVLGHVGHFNEQKNHNFLVNIFAQFHKKHPHSKLLLVGGGVLENEIRTKVNDLQLTDSVIFLGKRNDIENIMCGMDCFVFPSKWEGLGIVLIEAQATGLPCCVSSKVPEEAQMTSAYYRIDLKNSVDDWFEVVDLTINNKHDRKELSTENSIEVEKRGYSIQLERKKLVNIYLQ